MAFKSIFEHIRDNPDEPFLFHCTGMQVYQLFTYLIDLLFTAGKDRTGVLAALIMDAAGCDDEAIAKDYELTSIGLEPTRAATEAKFLSFPDFAGNVQAVRNTLGCRFVRSAMPSTFHINVSVCISTLQPRIHPCLLALLRR